MDSVLLEGVAMRVSYRVILGVLGSLVGLMGLMAWSIEDTYGHGLDFTIQSGPGEDVIVYEEAEGVGRRRPVFEGSPAEAIDYTERRMDAGRSFVLPGAIVAVGSVLIVLALFGWRKSDSQTLEGARRS